MSTSIDFNRILNHLVLYAGDRYINPETLESDQKIEMLKRKESAISAVQELYNLSFYFAQTYGLSNPKKSKWIVATRESYIRSYLWTQLKNAQHQELPTSLSVFAEKIDGQVQLRLSIELDLKNATVEDVINHHRLLDYTFPEELHFSYKISTDQSLDLINSNETIDQIKLKIDSNEYKKVQISFIVTLEEVQKKDLSNEAILDLLNTAFEPLLGCYRYILQHSKDPFSKKTTLGRVQQMHSKNTILYGPPGTGKTYHTVLYAVAIIEGKEIDVLKKESYEDVMKRYQHYKLENRIAFTTFHQSYGYEEFIEGIKPSIEEDQPNVEFKIQSGTFKSFCDAADKLTINTERMHMDSGAQVWKVSLGGSGQNELKQDCFDNNRIRIGWEDFGKDPFSNTDDPTGNVKSILNDFYNEMEVGDFVFSLKDQYHIDAIGVIADEPEWLDGKEYYIQSKNDTVLTHYKRSRTVEWLIKDVNINIFEVNKRKKLTQKTVYKLRRITLHDVKTILQGYSPMIKSNQEPYVFIIDEINRGNVSKILGELITLIEPSKRIGAEEELFVQLPYSKTDFGVPDNIYILGTMNTADRSIALLDTALRRRFQFIEMLPDVNVFGATTVGNIEIGKMLSAINQRIEVLYDREHTIGHAYFIPLLKDSTIETLKRIFINSIIPLLQEYFYEDYSKIQLILGDNDKHASLQFIQDNRLQINSIFKGNPNLSLSERQFVLQLAAFSNPDSYIQIYE